MRRFLLLSLVLWLSPMTAFTAEFDQDKLKAIAPAMQSFVKQHQIAGAVTVVGNRKGVVRIDAVGKRLLDPATEMTADTIFRIASMTKPITAAAVMILADEGKLKYTDPVEKHLPEFRGQMLVKTREKDRLVLEKPARPITLRDLLTHTSGLPNYPAGLGEVYFHRKRSLAETTLAVSQCPLDFAPGSKWSYCNSGIDTLGRVVEVVSGQPFEAFLARRIFEPLGMKDTTFTPTKEQLARTAGVYAEQNGKLIQAKKLILGSPIGSRHPIPAGGLFSTGRDVARFYQMMLNEGTYEGKKIFSPQSVQSLTDLHTGDLRCGFTEGMGFGLGFAHVRKPEGVTSMLSPGSFGHGGAFGTQSWADPKKGLFLILMIQRVGLRNGDASPMRMTFQKLAVDAIEP